jgi:hypothetical protein
MELVFLFFFRKGDQLLDVNEHNLSATSIEEAYQILNTLPHGRVTLRIQKTDLQGEQLPTNVNHELDKLNSERTLLDKKLAKKPKVGINSGTLENNRQSHNESFGEFIDYKQTGIPAVRREDKRLSTSH